MTFQIIIIIILLILNVFLYLKLCGLKASYDSLRNAVDLLGIFEPKPDTTTFHCRDCQIDYEVPVSSIGGISQHPICPQCGNA